MLLGLVPTLLALVPIGHFREPVYVTSPPGAKHTIVVAERSGLIREVRGRVERRAYADLRRRVVVPARDEEVDQRGLFTIAFPSDYRRTKRFYVEYVDRHSRQRIDEVRRRGRRIRHVLDLGKVGLQHHGGQLQFGPDGLLYASTGAGEDGTGRGEIFRFDPRKATAVKRYASGLRNPWRFSFAPGGALIVGDVGNHTWEEVDVVPPGGGVDFGWPEFEGPGGGDTPPALAHRHSDGWCAITGGYVVKGRYVYGDLCTGKLWGAHFTGTTLTDDRPLGITVPYLDSFGRDARGRVYAVSFNGGVFRLSPPARARSRPAAGG